MENPEMMKEIVRESVDFAKAQLDELVAAYYSGRQVEFECFSPYASDHDLKNGDVHTGGLTNEEEIGLAVLQMLREEFPNARNVSLFDEYNTDMPDSTEPSGRPMFDGKQPQIAMSDTAKEHFRFSISELLRERGVQREDDLLIPESSKQESAQELANQLEAQGLLQEENGELFFVNPHAENPDFSKIQLRTKNGRWRCEALDASTYLNPLNREITHLVILSNHFKDQQDKVWEILRALGIDNKGYHNIFYDKTMPPAMVAEVIRERIGTAKQAYHEQRTVAAAA